ncbi:hypothetical protein HanXRQr2_Chr12g0532601 [Helianthus annuus]|uniref:Uncharacterized protein n=1 Tax=Helianthus annuus TaxID=4232 RepID=A0A9K3HF42_HELAN|nr:hypothetical protein HanXRQr2_Chr12g0532601 [Helianthus annuus]KAJ0504604.1 hypothetical protein HanHA89_Chr12g0461141 [Helianthus annuus]KAJ0674329.1 hypothetical protein HanLR1_Chr12g0438761 [Helianthus annuus]KAJ0862003.1 hypothetical protein HanPSC8_Chr12g0513131 [Helianthus annuus]
MCLVVEVSTSKTGKHVLQTGLYRRFAEESDEFEEFGAKRAKIRDLEFVFRSEGFRFNATLCCLFM